MPDNNRFLFSRQKSPSRNRTNSATDSNQPVSTLESLSVNTQLTKDKNSRDTSPVVRTRRFSGDIVLPPSPSTEESEPSLFSPGSVRARTINSIQENNNNSSTLPKRQNSLSSSSSVDPPPHSPLKRLDIRLSSGKTVNTSDFIHSNSDNHLINPHIQITHDQQQQQPISNETTRNKLLQSVYINNPNTHPSSSLAESLTNGTNYHTHPTESSSNCILS
jgi:hypothetical protein